MTTGLVRLLGSVPPPANPLEARGKWRAVESKLGTTLPAEYRDFIREYGTGLVGGFVAVFNPFAKNRYLNLLLRGREILEMYDVIMKGQHPLPLPQPLYPQRG